MNNLIFIIYLIFIIIISIIIITYFFFNFIESPIEKNKTGQLNRIIKYLPNTKSFFKRNSRLKGCIGERCINGGYCYDCKGPSASCCCYDIQCLDKR